MTKAAFSDGFHAKQIFGRVQRTPCLPLYQIGGDTGMQVATYLPVACARCKRPLKNEISRERHYGPACYRKVLAEADGRQEKLFEEVP